MKNIEPIINQGEGGQILVRGFLQLKYNHNTRNKELRIRNKKFQLIGNYVF